MKHVARLNLSFNCGESSDAVTGEGTTPEEAMLDCLRKARQYVELSVELSGGAQLPPEVAAMLPKDKPEGTGLLIMERLSHNTGNAYEWRVFAVPVGKLDLCQYFQGERSMSGGREYLIGENPTKYSFMDCNADYEFPLPKGSHEFEAGVWYSRDVAKYGY